ncbi:MAG: ATP-binding cassette domain-containing protein [Clostridium sp.]
MRELIEFDNINKSYEEKKVLENISLKIKKEEFITIIGSSGCGKTTLIKLINGLIKGDDGNIFINGVNIQDLNIIKLRRKIGYVVQGVGLFPHMKIKENIIYVMKLEGIKDREVIEGRIKELLKIASLDMEVLNKFPRELSGGQCQRIGIARALANKPEILLMDEPFGAVDEITRKSLQEELIKIYKKEKITIIFITHDIKEALKLGSRVIVMDKFKIVQDGTPKEIIQNPKTDFVKELIKDK